MAKTDPAEGGSEKLQIAILTFFMTAGGFLILTLFFTLFYNPGQEARMKSAEKTYDDLAKLLGQQDMRRLRQQDRLSQEKESTQSLAEIISQNLATYGIEYREFRAPKKSAKGEGITEITQPITLQPAAMTPILQFVASVQDAKKTIRVLSLDLNRDKRADEEADSWQATVVFVDYETGPQS